MKSIVRIWILCLLLLTSIGLNCYGQQQKVTFEHLTIQHGLSHNYVMAVMQDRKGYLWFGTGNGLDKFDGYNFTNFKFDPHDSTSLSKNQVLTLWEDKYGIIWIGTTEGTCTFDPRTEKFTRLGKTKDNPYAFNYAQSFNEDTEGNIWVGGSFAGELRQIDRRTGKFSSINYAPILDPKIESSTKERLYVTYKDKSGTLWIGSPTGLHKLHLSKEGSGKLSKVSFTHFRHHPTEYNSISPKGVAGIYEDREGILWVMTLSGILDAFDTRTGKFTHYRPGDNQTFDVERLIGSKMTEDLEGNLWIGTLRTLYRLDKTRREFTQFSHDPSDQTSLNNNSVYSLLVDRAGILWVATPEGVNKADPHKKPFHLYRHNPKNFNSLSHNKVTAICEDKEGIIWIGTMGEA